ncbi:unnamed protein product [Nyctereutes procyonoides]|uniref:(raccoon dog) hypothetical protein n=1 Tax=Nyctereutes procyonoides TaxID=34880 RepID=A0A811YEQ0_NYCPR|nr:unnamed protein product [Nyctereutes procyonoides]
MLPGVGVFGTSLTARVIIPLLKDEGFAVKALWGRTQEEAEELAKEMSVPFYTSRIDEVLLHQDVDLVCINLPPPLTRQIAVKTLVPKGRLWGRTPTSWESCFLGFCQHLGPPTKHLLSPLPRLSLHPRGKVAEVVAHEASTNSTGRCWGSQWDCIGYIPSGQQFPVGGISFRTGSTFVFTIHFLGVYKLYGSMLDRRRW